MAWGEDAETLAAWCDVEGSHSAHVGVWDTKTGKLLGKLGDLDQASRVGVALVSKERVVVSQRGTLRVFDGFTPKKDVESYLVYDGIALSPDRQHLLFTNGYGVRALDFGRLEKRTGHDFHTAAAMHRMRIHWAPNSKMAAVDHDYEAVVLVDARARRRATVQVPGSKTPGFTDVSWAPDSSVLYIAQADGAVAIVDGKSGAVKRVLQKPSTELGLGEPEIAVTPDGRAVVTSKAGSGVSLFVDGERRGIAPAAPSMPGPHLAISRDGSWLALGYETQVTVHAMSDPDDETVVLRVPQMTDVAVLGWTPDGTLVVHAGDSIVGWSAKSKRERFRTELAGLANASLSSDGALVAVAHGTLTVLRTDDQKRIALEPLAGVAEKP